MQLHPIKGSVELSVRNWVEKYRNAVQNAELIELVDAPDLFCNQVGAWAFLKLAFLWNYAYYTYIPIIGRRYSNMCYVDLFSGSGLDQFSDCSGNPQLILGSPLLMATINSQYPFKTCFFFEANSECADTLSRRLHKLEESSRLTCKYYELFCDCNKDIDKVINNLKGLDGCHFLLFVDPFSTEIKWETMEKLLKLNYPSFDMIFNFQPFGVNRKSYNPKTITEFLGDSDYNAYKHTDERILEALENQYLQKLRKFPNIVKVIKRVRIKSGTGSFYYDLIFTTRKAGSPWVKNIDYLKKVIEKLTGYSVSIIFDPTIKTLNQHIK